MNNTSAASFFLVTRVMLEQTCYRRHPGKKTQCMRGAMANSGLVCQDCHGNMAQVGNDFTRDVSPANPGAFELAVDFYNNPDTPRVPWANEPGCGGCHTGSTTDNLASDQLQGHTGTIIECTVCHSGSFDIEDFKNAMSEHGMMEGPHGMHPVNNAMWNEKHKEVSNLNKNSCRSCHGQNGEGTVLSRAAEDRVLRCKDTELRGCNSQERIQVSRGTMISCTLCHSNQL